jgi:hypothetical protein
MLLYELSSKPRFSSKFMVSFLPVCPVVPRSVLLSCATIGLDMEAIMPAIAATIIAPAMTAIKTALDMDGGCLGCYLKMLNREG